MAAAASRLLQLSGTLGAAAAALPELKLREVAQGIALDLATLARSLEVSSVAVTKKRLEKRLPTATVKAYPKDAVTALCCNGADVISGSDGGCLKRWSIDTGKCLAEAQGHRDSILKLEWHSADSEGRLFSISKDRSLKIWSGQLQCQQAIEGLPRGVSSLAVLGSTFAVGARDHQIHLWSSETLQPLRKFQGHSDAVLAVESCQPLELLVSGGNDRSVRLWDRTEAACRAVLLGHGGPVTCVAVCAQRRMVASGSKDKTVKLWNIDQESCVATLEGHKSYVRALTFLTDGHLASGSSDRSCRLWDVELQSCQVELEDHSDSVLVLTGVTTMTGQRLVSGSDDTTLKIWSTERASGK